METLYHLPWRGYPALALVLLGVALMIRAFRGDREAARRHRFGTDARSLAAMRAFRRAVIGLACIGVAAGWHWQVPWLLALALAIGFEETFESSIDVAALEQAEQRHRPRTNAYPARPT